MIRLSFALLSLVMTMTSIADSAPAAVPTAACTRAELRSHAKARKLNLDSAERCFISFVQLVARQCCETLAQMRPSRHGPGSIPPNT